MDHEWIVEVKDSAGAEVTSANVALVKKSDLGAEEWPFAAIASTHKHVSAGKYEATAPITPLKGDWVLIVRASGKSPVVQPLKMEERGKTELVTRPAPKTAATLSFTTEVRVSGAAKIRRASFKVTLFPSSEVVAISGTEYFDAGTQFKIFALNHWTRLRAGNTIDAGAIATLFSTDERARETMVPAAGGGWLKVASKSFGSTAGIVPGKSHAPVVGSDISVTDLYDYVSAVGGAEPGRVKEVSLFSHAWPGGPILYNTDDDRRVPARLPTDFDARMKDFSSPNIDRWPGLKRAIAAGGTWRVWGCSATTHHKNLVVAAHREKPAGDAKYFLVTTTVQHHDGSTAQTVEEKTTRAHVRAQMDLPFRSLSYMAAASAHLGVPVFGPPPGAGASFSKSGLMFVDMKEYAVLFAYFKDQFGPEFAPTTSPDDTGYVDYTKVRARPAPAKPAFNSAWYRLTKVISSDKFALEFDNGWYLVETGAKIKLSQTAMTGFAAPGKSGHLYVLRDPVDPSKSRGLFLQEDQAVFRVDADATGKFTVLGPRL